MSIGITPASASIVVGGKQLYTAVATYANGPTANVTAQVTWTASDPSTVSIGASALAFGLKAGRPVTITATLGGLTSNPASLTVTPPPGGLVLDWGVDESGELGNGTIASYSDFPVAVSGSQNAIAVAAGAVSISP